MLVVAAFPLSRHLVTFLFVLSLGPEVLLWLFECKVLEKEKILLKIVCKSKTPFGSVAFSVIRLFIHPCNVFFRYLLFLYLASNLRNNFQPFPHCFFSLFFSPMQSLQPSSLPAVFLHLGNLWYITVDEHHYYFDWGNQIYLTCPPSSQTPPKIREIRMIMIIMMIVLDSMHDFHIFL